nr:hypothetical protein [Tanacetum cinerariifolium]
VNAKVKTSLGYDSQFNEKEVLDVKEEEVTETVFDNCLSDEENSLANDRFKKGEGFHVVPPPLTRNYMPPKPDLSFAGLNDSIYKFKISETVTSLSKDVKDAPETSTAFIEKPKEVRTRKGTGHRECRLVWNNIQRINHQNKFSPTTIFTRSGRIPISTTKPKAAASTSTTNPVNPTRPKQSVNFSNSKISAIKGNGVTAVKSSAGNKAYLADYQEINNEGFVAFGSTRDPLGKFKGKADKGFWLGTMSLVKLSGYLILKPEKLKRICMLVSAGNQTDKNAGLQDTNGNADDKAEDNKPKDDTSSKTVIEPVNKEDQAYKDTLNRIMSQEKEVSDATDYLSKDFKQGCMDQRGATKAGSTNSFNTVSNPVNAASTLGTFTTGGPLYPHPDAFIIDDTILHVEQDDS